MIIYIFEFCLITILLYVCIKNPNKVELNAKQIKNRKLTIGIVVLVLSTIAGLRDISIGSDTKGYGYWVFYACRSTSRISDFPQLLFFSKAGQTYEVGYLLLNFIISRFTSSMNVAMFIISAITMTLFIKSFTYYEKYAPLWYSTVIFLLLNYNETFNLIRQSLAASIVLCGFKYIKEKKVFNYSLVILLAMQFHKGAVLAFVFYLIYLIVDSKHSFIKQATLIGITIGALLSLEQIVNFLIASGVLPLRYSAYIENNNLTLHTNNLILRLPMLVFLIYKRKEIKDKICLGNLLSSLYFIEAILINAVSLGGAAYRIVSFVAYGRLLLFPQLPLLYEKGKKRQIAMLIIGLYVFAMWVYIIAIKNSNETIPYLIGFTNI